LEEFTGVVLSLMTNYLSVQIIYSGPSPNPCRQSWLLKETSSLWTDLQNMMGFRLGAKMRN